MMGRGLKRGCGAPRGRWYASASFALAGLALAAIEAIGGQPAGQVIFAVVLFWAVAAVLALGGRSEGIRAFRGDLSDERLEAIQLRAVAVAGRAVIAAAVIAFMVQLALGHSGAPYYWLAAIGGLTYLAAYVYGVRH